MAEVIRRGAVSSEVLNPPPPPLPTAYGSGVSNTPTIQREGRPSRAKGSGKASVVNYGPHQRVWRVLDSPPGRLSLAGASRQTPTGPIPTPTPRHSHFGEQPRPRRRAARPWPRHGRRRSAARRPSARAAAAAPTPAGRPARRRPSRPARPLARGARREAPSAERATSGRCQRCQRCRRCQRRGRWLRCQRRWRCQRRGRWQRCQRHRQSGHGRGTPAQGDHGRRATADRLASRLGTASWSGPGRSCGGCSEASRKA